MLKRDLYAIIIICCTAFIVLFTRQIFEDKTKIKQATIQNSVAYVNVGLKQLNKKEYKKSIPDFNKAIRIYFKNAEAYYYRGYAKYRLQDNISAKEDFDQAIKYNPNFAKAYLYRGLTMNRLYKDFPSVEDYDKAIKLDPQYYAAYYIRGLTKDRNKDYKGAIDDYSRALAVNPDSSEMIYAYRGMAKYKLSEQDPGAINDLHKALDINPLNDLAYTYRGFMRLRAEKYQAALEDYNKAIELKPHHHTYIERGFVKHKLLDYDGALKDYNKALELAPDVFPSDYDFRGHVKYHIKDYNGAIQDYTLPIKKNPTHHIYAFISQGSFIDDNLAVEKKIEQKDTFYNHHGIEHYKKQEYDKAFENFTKAIEINVNNYYAYYHRALLKTLFKDYESALIDIEKAVSLAHHPEIILSRGNIYLHIALSYTTRQFIRYDSTADNYKKGILYLNKALLDYDKALFLSPKYVKAYNNRGFVKLKLATLRGTKNNTALLGDFNKAIELDPHYIKSYLNRASIYAARHEFSQAIKDCNQVIKINPASAVAYTLRSNINITSMNMLGGLLDKRRSEELSHNNYHYLED